MPRATRPRRPLLARLLMALAAVGLFLIGYQWGNQFQFPTDRPPGIGGVLVLPPQPVIDLQLTASADGRPVGQGDLAGHWTLLTLAPASSAAGHLGVGRLVEVANRLAGDGALRERLRLWLVSADDAPALARDFERLTPMLRILTGTPDALARLHATLGSAPALTAPPTAAGEETRPSLFLLDPDGQLLALFPAAQPAAAVAEDLLALSRWRGRPVSNAPETDDP